MLNPVHTASFTRAHAAELVARADTTSSEDASSSSESSESDLEDSDSSGDTLAQDGLEQDLREQLQQLGLGGLQQRAVQLGVDAVELTNGLDQENPKAALVNLIVHKVLPSSSPVCE